MRYSSFEKKLYTVDADIFLNMIEEAILRNCLKDEVDLTSESVCLEIGWNNLPQCCINGTTLNNFKSHIHKVLDPETE